MTRTVLSAIALSASSRVLLFDCAIKGAAILLLACAVVALLRKESAAVRHLVWQSAFVALLIVPLLAATLPEWRVLPTWATLASESDVVANNISMTAPETMDRNTTTDLATPSPAMNPDEAVSVPVDRHSVRTPVRHHDTVRWQTDQATTPAMVATHDTTAASDTVPTVPTASIRWTTVLLILWSVGTGLLLLRLLAARWMLRNRERSASIIAVWHNGSSQPIRTHVTRNACPEEYKILHRAFESACRKLQINQHVSLLLNSDHTIPLVWGIRQHRLQLPVTALQWSDSQLKSVLLHELGHIRRRDALFQILAQVACAFYWFNPLVWFAAWRLHVERERACDDLVLGNGVMPSIYAEHLLNVATQQTSTHWTQACGLAMAGNSSLHDRLQAILCMAQKRSRITITRTVFTLAMTLAMIIPVAMLKAADEDSPPADTQEKRRPQPDDAPDKNDTTRHGTTLRGDVLSDEITQRIKWGTSVAGLRTAIVILSVAGVPQDIFLMVQNVSQAEIRISDFVKPGRYTLYFKRNGAIQQALHAEESDFGTVALPPSAAFMIPVFPLGENKNRISGKAVTDMILGDGKLSVYAKLEFRNVPDGTFTGTLVSKEVTGEESVISLQKGNSKKQQGQKLNVATEQRLSWGKPVNGLRAALAMRDSSDGGDSEAPDLYMVVQNISEAPVRLEDTSSAPNGRYILIQRDDLMQAQTVTDEPTGTKVTLRPREAVYMLMLPRREGPKKGQLLSKGILKEPRMILIGQLNIQKTAAGAWTGELVTGKTSGRTARAFQPPKHVSAQTLFTRWQGAARLNGMIPGGQLTPLIQATKNFVKFNPTDARAPKLEKLLTRMDTSHDWAPVGVVDLLNDVTDIYDSLPQWAMELDRFEISAAIRTGEPLPKVLESAPWGEATADGLRGAWLLDPQAEQHRLNTPLKSRLLYHNTGKDTVVFRILTWNQSGGHKALDADGKEIETRSVMWTTIGQIIACRLAPGEYTEVMGAGIGIGPNQDQEDWRNTRVGTWIHARAGDEVTFRADAISAAGKDGRQSSVPDEVWWPTFITNRLNQDAPLPKEAAERKRILKRAVSDLFGTPPTSQEYSTFINDKSPDAMSALAGRLARRVGTVSFTGRLKSGDTRFRVLPVDPESANKPRVANGPGRYELGTHIRLQITRRGDGTNRATLMFLSNDGAADPFEIRLPDGYDTWAIGWKKQQTVMWLAEKGVLRRIDFTKPTEITDTPLTPPDLSKLPTPYQKALRSTFTGSK